MISNTRLVNGVRVEMGSSDLASVALSVGQLKFEILEKLRAVFNARYYADISVVDVYGNECEIQFRNEVDKSNIIAVAVMAEKIKAGGLNVQFRTSDNVTRVFLASAFSDIASSILATKQSVLQSYWDKKDLLNSLDNIEGSRAVLENFDVEDWG